jgi:hypothetical protein
MEIHQVLLKLKKSEGTTSNGPNQELIAVSPAVPDPVGSFPSEAETS